MNSNGFLIEAELKRYSQLKASVQQVAVFPTTEAQMDAAVFPKKEAQMDAAEFSKKEAQLDEQKVTGFCASEVQIPSSSRKDSAQALEITTGNDASQKTYSRRLSVTSSSFSSPLKCLIKDELVTDVSDDSSTGKFLAEDVLVATLGDTCEDTSESSREVPKCDQIATMCDVKEEVIASSDGTSRRSSIMNSRRLSSTLSSRKYQTDDEEAASAAGTLKPRRNSKSVSSLQKSA